jgi:tripartite-type tricarboxylate transporter receptor subunit TctC
MKSIAFIGVPVRRLCVCLSSLVLGLGAVGQLLAQPFPSKPVKILVGYPSGSSIDVVARGIAEQMALGFGSAVIVENRAGASGIIATQELVHAPADGYTLFAGAVDSAVYAYIEANRKPLDPFSDIVPISRLTRDHWVLAVSPTLGVNSVKELITLGKASSGKLSYASIGIATAPHLLGEKFRQLAGFEATHVPYKDSFVPDLVTGRVSSIIHVTAAIGPLIKSGKLKGLAVLSRERIPMLPDVPTTAEAGFPDLVFNAGILMFAPRGTPPEIIGRLNAAIGKAEGTASVKQLFADLGVEIAAGTPAEAAKFIMEQMAVQDPLRSAVLGRAR